MPYKAYRGKEKARAKFKQVYIKWHERKQNGQMPNSDIKALPKIRADKDSDHMVEERMRKRQTKNRFRGKRIDNLRGK